MGYKMSYTIKEVNFDTGEIIERDLTESEIEILENDRSQLAAQQNETEALLQKRTLALSKLVALGLDLDDLRALGLQHNL